VSQHKKLAILVGGGPAPGINSVISAATIEARNHGFAVLGILDGFRWLMQGDVSRVRNLSFDDVSRIHLTGGSVLGTARDNPTRDEKAMAAVVATLSSLGVTHLITIGGDDTALSSSHVDRRSERRRRADRHRHCSAVRNLFVALDAPHRERPRARRRRDVVEPRHSDDGFIDAHRPRPSHRVTPRRPFAKVGARDHVCERHAGGDGRTDRNGVLGCVRIADRSLAVAREKEAQQARTHQRLHLVARRHLAFANANFRNDLRPQSEHRASALYQKYRVRR
jgi:hypothetical protein